MRYLTVLIVCGLFFLGVQGCGRGEPERPEVGEPARKLTLWHILNYSGPREVIEAAVARFEAAHPGVDVEVQTFDNDPYKTKLAIEMGSGTPPDIFFTWGGGHLAEQVAGSRVLDLTSAVAETEAGNGFLPAALDLCTVEDRVFAAPLDLANVVIWYSRSLFAEHGLSPPTDFEGLLTLCRALRADGITPFALGNREQWPGAFFYVYLAARHGGTRLFLDAAGRKGPGFDTPAFIDAGRDLQRLVEADAFPTGFNGVEDAQARTRFVNGQAAMYLMGTWLVARVARENPDFLGDLDCFAFPAVAGGRGETSTVVGGVNAAFAVSSSCRYPDLAVELIRELTAPDAVRAWCESGRIPALRADDAALAALPGPTRAAFRLLETAAALQPYYDQYLPPRLAEMHKTTTQGLFAGTLTPEQAAARMEACARELAEAQ